MTITMNRHLHRTILSLTLGGAMVLSAGAVPTAAMTTSQPSEPSVTRMVRAMLDRGAYREGEAIVITRGHYKPPAPIKAKKLSSVDDETMELSLEGGTDASVLEAKERIEENERNCYTIFRVTDRTQTTESLLQELYQDKNVISAEPNYLVEPMPTEAITSDGEASAVTTTAGASSLHGATEAITPGTDISCDLSSLQWYVNKDMASRLKTPSAPAGTGYNLGVPGWNRGADNASGTVCLLDTGLDVTNPDLQGALYTFTEEQQQKYGCGPYGRNFTINDQSKDKEKDQRNISDHNGHSTHLAGIIAGDWNGKGISGITRGVKVFSARVFSDGGDAQGLTDIIRALEWLTTIARDVNLKAVNASLGSERAQISYTVMVNKLGSLGVNTVFASGNLNNNLDNKVDIGGENTSPYALTVNAADMDGKRTVFSCYGQVATDVFAPGTMILSTAPASFDKRYDNGSLIMRDGYITAFPEKADPTHLANNTYERFEADAPSVHFYDRCPVRSDGTKDPDAKEFGQRITGAGKGYLDSNSWGLNVASLPADKKVVMGNEAASLHSVWLTIPVESGKKQDWLSFRTSLDSSDHFYFGFAGIMCNQKQKDGSRTVKRVDMGSDLVLSKTEKPESGDFPVGNHELEYSPSVSAVSWQPISVNLKEFLRTVRYVHEQGSAEILEESGVEDPGDIEGFYEWNHNGKTYLVAELGVKISKYVFGEDQDQEPERDVAQPDTNLLIDDVAVGDSEVPAGPYYYMNGTSMSAPIVSACLCVIAKDEPASATLSDEELSRIALERKAKLLACVDYDEDLAAYCRSGGRVNLHNQTTFTEKAPILTDAVVTDNTVTVNGYFLGTSGTMKIDGNEVNVLSHTDTAVTADITGLSNGSHLALVTNTDGYVSRIRINVSGAGQTPQLFENTIPTKDMILNDEWGYDYNDIFFDNIVGVNGKLYAIGSTSDNTGHSINDLWVGDGNGTWKKAGDLPAKMLSSKSTGGNIIALKGKLYLFRVGEYGTKPEFWRYTPSKDKWKLLKLSKAKKHNNSYIFVMKGSVFLLDKYHNKLFRINLKNGKLKKVKASIPSNLSASTYSIAASGSKAYSIGTLDMMGDGSEYKTMFFRMNYKKNKNKMTFKNLSSSINKAFGKEIWRIIEKKNMQITGIPGGIALVGSLDPDTYPSDTYILKNNGTKISPYNKRASYYQMSYPYACYDAGRLFVLGLSPQEYDLVFLRSTAIG